MSTEVGSGQVAIFPTFKGFRKAVGDETDASAKTSSSGFGKIWQKASSSIGRSSGKGFASTFNSSTASVGAAATKKLQTEVAAASRALSASRLKEQDSAGRVRIAETALTAARATGAAGSLKVVTAEERLASAQRADAAAKDTAVTATNRLTVAQKSLAAAIASQNASSRGVLSRLFSGGANIGESAGKAIGGGFVRTFKSALSPLAGLVAGFIGFQLIESGFQHLKSVVQSSLSTMSEWAVLNAQSSAFIKSTGGVAGVTATQVHNLSSQIEELTGTSLEQVQSGANIVGTFKNIRNAAGKGNDIFNQTTLAAVNMARALGKDVPTSALMLSKALNDPAAGLSKLTRAGVTFTKQQQDEIKSLVKTGQTLQAQKLILAEVNSEFGASGVEFRSTIPGALTVLQGSLAATGVKLTQSLSPAIVNVLDLATKVVDTFRDSPFVAGLITKLDTYVARVTTKLTGVIGLVQDLAGSSKGVTFAGVSGGLEKIFPSLKPILSLFNIAAPVVASVVKQLGPQLTKSVQELLPGVGKLLIAILPILPPLTKLAVAVIPLLVDAVNVLSPAVKFLVDQSLTPLFKMISLVLNFLQGNTTLAQFGAQSQKLGGIFPWLLQVIQSFVNGTFGFVKTSVGFVRQLRDNIDSAVGFFVGLQVRILRAVAGAERWLIGVGERIIDGLIAGIRNHLGDLGRFLGTIGNFIVQHKGPPSADAVLLNDNGALIMQGLIAGIESKKRDLSRMLSSVQSSLVASTTGGSSGAAPSSRAVSGPVNVTQHIYAAPGQDERLIGRGAGREFARAIAGSI